MVLDINPDSTTYNFGDRPDLTYINSSSPSNLTDLNGTVFFTATGPQGLTLWSSDGTAGGTVPFQNISLPGGPHDSSFTPPDNGLYTVTFTVTDDANASTSSWDTITVSNVAPRNVSAGPNRTVNEVATVSLHGSFTDPGSLDGHTYLWHVTDNNGQVVADGTSQDFSFTPDDDGAYTVIFTVTDKDGPRTPPGRSSQSTISRRATSRLRTSPTRGAAGDADSGDGEEPGILEG